MMIWEYLVLIDYLNTTVIINQLSSPYILCGDFNGHSTLWSSENTNRRGAILEEVINDYNLIPLNTVDHTRYDVAHNTSSLIDLTLVQPSIYLDFTNKVLPDLCGSDHYPILVSIDSSDIPETERIPKWNFKKAKWGSFQEQC